MDEKLKQSENFGLNAIPYLADPNAKRLYAVGCYTPDDWQYIHEVLLKDGTLEDNIPKESIECADLKEHSLTRAIYLLTDEEAQKLIEHPKVEFVHINYSSYPEQFKPPPEELTSGPVRNYRYSEPTKHYRHWFETSQLPATPNSSDINRSGYQLLRCVDKEDPWYTGISTGAQQVFSDRIQYYGDGSDVDLVVGDEGCWFGHVEFVNNATGFGPANYVGTNVLKSGFSASATTGTCDVLDLLLDGPYYIDPDWFEADPTNRLTLRWDGTTVPVDSVARSWWMYSTERSVGFSTIGTVGLIDAGYTRDACNGSANARPTIDTNHGTQCCANAFGRTQGWAFNANKWFINAYGDSGSDIEQYFDILKLFHLYKPINPTYGTKDPTINSNSWGYRSSSFRTTAYYFYRQGSSGGTGVAYNASSIPEFMKYVGIYGDSSRMKGEHPPNAYLSAGKEMIDAGVIFVVAAGNSNQKQVGPDHPDFNNYWADTNNASLTSATHSEFGITAYNTTNRRGFPQQLGMYTDPITSKPIYPAINIGALDDSYHSSGKEWKVRYSDMGEEIDCYAPADGTLSAVNDVSGYLRPDTYSGGAYFDEGFTAIASASARISGTSSFNAFPNTGQRVTTNASSGTVTSITASLLGAASLTSSTPGSPGALTFNGNTDDGYWIVPLPWNVSFNGASYSTIYIGTNSYITFSSGATSYGGLGLTNPAVPKIMISSQDNSCQRIYYGTEGSSPNRTYRIRWEGTASFGGTLGSPNMVYEAVFYEAFTNQFDIQIGVNARVNAGSFYDDKFSGTSSACPVAAGLIATKLQYNRNWTWQDIRSWLRNTVGDANTNQFYTGVESTSANDSNWSDVNSLEGGRPMVIWDALTGNEPLDNPIPDGFVTFASGKGLTFRGVNIKFT